MPSLIVVAGPTASGKTSVAIRLAQHFSTEILSADSRQFYRGLDIGTAKPNKKELSLVKHHFIDSHELHELYNISDFEKDALSLLNKIFKKNEVAILVGGSGLYIRSVCEGIDDIPGRDENIRNEIQELLDKEGLIALQNKLKVLDPEYFNKTDISNPHRLIRALEVCMLTGKKFSELRKSTVVQRPFQIIKIGLLLEREELYRRIDQRVDQMMADGLMDEARSLSTYKNLNALNTVGYKELFDLFEGKTTEAEAIELIKKNTRNYAKRQMTWFRREEEIKWFDPEDFSEIVNFIEKQIRT
jgi:tRNA dimethylallyltransferase